MIKAGSKLSIQRIPLACLQVTEYVSCFPEKFAIYLQLLQGNPDQDVDPLVVIPSPTHSGMFTVKNGKHRYCASIMAGRPDVLCIVVEEPSREDERDMVEK
jgi:hypothetical protein